MDKYDLLVVGAGLYGAVFAHEAHAAGLDVLVIDKRSHVGGNVYSQSVGGIAVHKYGAHIFHTDDEEVWQYVNALVPFNRFTNSPLARFKGEIYNLPFNMNTFHQMWDVTTPDEARAIIDRQRAEITGEPQNLEQQAISLVGRDIYEKLIKGYTEKQWGRQCRDLPAFIIRRIPVRFVYDNNYFSDRFQGIPLEGYTPLVEKLLDGIEVRLSTEYSHDLHDDLAHHILYTGPIDAFFDYRLGQLEYRSLRFETKVLKNVSDYQGNAVINETAADVPYTRVIEHKHFMCGNADVLNLNRTVVTYEYPQSWHPGDEPYYPVNDERNNALCKSYLELASRQRQVMFGGRLGLYKYMDMDDTVRMALDNVRAFLAAHS